MMKKDKKIIIIISLIILAIAGIILTICLLNNKDNKKMTKKEEDLYKDLAYIENISLINEHQKKLEENYKKTFKESNYTLDNPYVVNNPYEIAPLSTLIMFETNKEIDGKITIKGKDNEKDLVFEFDKNKTHYITIWGLYANYKNQVVIETSDGNKKELEIDTSIENNIDTNLVEVNANTNKINDFYVLDTPIGTEFYLIDSSGNIRGTFRENISKFITQLDNSHILISDGKLNVEGMASGLLEMDLNGKVYNYYKLDYEMSYGSKKLDNGNILYMTQNQTDVASFDTIVEINNQGKLVRTINIYDLMTEIDSELMNKIGDKWGYISGIDYDAKNDQILVSLWYSSAVIGIDYNSGKIEWILSNPTNLSDKFNDYLLTPIDANFEYPKGPYAVNITDDGFSLMVTNWDINDSLTCSSIIDRRSYVANYKVDLTNKKISINNSFGKDKNYFSYALGDYNKYENYNLVLFGRELLNANYNDSTCMLNNHWDLYSKLLLTNNTGEIIYDATINGPFVIAEKYNINKKVNNTFIDAKSYNFEFEGNKEEIKNYENYSEAIKKGYVSNYGFKFEENKLIIDANEGEKLLLISSKNKVYEYEYKTDGIDNYYLLNTHNEYFKVYIEKDGEVYNTETYLYI